MHNITNTSSSGTQPESYIQNRRVITTTLLHQPSLSLLPLSLSPSFSQLLQEYDNIAIAPCTILLNALTLVQWPSCCLNSNQIRASQIHLQFIWVKTMNLPLLPAFSHFLLFPEWNFSKYLDFWSFPDFLAQIQGNDIQIFYGRFIVITTWASLNFISAPSGLTT